MIKYTSEREESNILFVAFILIETKNNKSQIIFFTSVGRKWYIYAIYICNNMCINAPLFLTSAILVLHCKVEGYIYTFSLCYITVPHQSLALRH